MRGKRCAKIVGGVNRSRGRGLVRVGVGGGGRHETTRLLASLVPKSLVG
ncbi:MAG: hypothetical protein MJE68_19480 [Proteobacteria bacterium]|nr:hypothetical protein [Pseudomonadota bacterium]